jgi:hypothetical protein
MIFSSIKNFFFINKLTFLNYSILRIFQILEVKQLKVTGTILDVGSKKSISNVTNYILSNDKIMYLDNFSDNLNDLNINLAIFHQNLRNSYKNLFLMNVLEHIYYYQNCLNNFCQNLNRIYLAQPKQYAEYQHFHEQYIERERQSRLLKESKVSDTLWDFWIALQNQKNLL